MWLEIIYKPTSLFSLKLSDSTNSAGKSLPCPSPYSVKMALLNSIITYDSLETAKTNFNLIRDLNLLFSLPESFVINSCMIRILKDNDKVSKNLKTIEPFKSTVAFREYVYLTDKISIALDKSNLTDEESQFLQKWFVHINYFGKRGCFFQFSGFSTKETLSNHYIKILDQSYMPGIMFPMDDVDKRAEFKNMDNYNSQIKEAKRTKRIYIFPYRQAEASKNYRFFKRY
jgi:hypothetical protein